MLLPEDIENKEFRKSAIGYSPDEVDTFLNKTMTDYGDLADENLKLKDKIAELGSSLEKYRDLEDTIQRTLILAEKTAQEAESQAFIKGEQIKREAEIKASSILSESKNKQNIIKESILNLEQKWENTKTKISILLKTELELLDELELKKDNRDNEEKVLIENKDKESDDKKH